MKTYDTTYAIDGIRVYVRYREGYFYTVCLSQNRLLLNSRRKVENWPWISRARSEMLHAKESLK